MDLLFRRLTLVLCDGSPLEDALCASLHLLRMELPVDQMGLIVSAQGDGNPAQLVASCDESSGRLIRQAFSAASGRAWAMAFSSNEAVSLREPEAHPLFESISTFIPGAKDGSLLLAPVGIGHRITGALVLFTRRQHAYSAAHAKLIQSLSEAFGIALEHWLQRERLLSEQQGLVEDRRALENELWGDFEVGLIGARLGLRSVTEQVRRVAPLANAVMLIGEVGTGKTLIAHSLHRKSQRAKGPLVKLNCAMTDTAFKEALLGGKEHRGALERAQSGTLVLEDVGALPAEAQLTLNHLLQTQEANLRGVVVRVDVRLLVSTHYDLRKSVAAGTFREELWVRLNTASIVIPPLRERTEDIPALAEFILRKKAYELRRAVPDLAPEVVPKLLAYAWPGNVRELELVLEKALFVHQGGALQIDTTPPAPPKRPPTAPISFPTSTNLNETTAAHIKAVLAQTRGKIHGPGGAAELLGVKATTLRHRMDKLEITYLKKKS